MFVCAWWARSRAVASLDSLPLLDWQLPVRSSHYLQPPSDTPSGSAALDEYRVGHRFEHGITPVIK